ncbi:MAG: 16S rRNA (cytosine(1402)-N(4))-methyltransferase RsmH [Gammaproteobacteria bacterium]|nr:16S rRNA (cytosine(1402)-N(4))-methyltransferase RsmH [Gammaproteobacteria bacterium]MBP6051694.1 16S rRNA (cytosine(1402)-N(4))-methyltransferase RsmH [Pseudomonadales bacterium]MBK6584703.1 16S rRNA (cytosine(1402)-N(4))-methyltransferase RsmH [Gammaproteobacteria bacterium]MBK7519788.1 16S rRNA (cytosine(1402)-N(4))-methyltransferase RsmH [Gammaproteobacteria bacterium]MBK7730966.1 16S rRNA (cytosine(1402)-N(4))-methyltransferase RsmH [Gammaproteobacteria bacterium]
MHTPVMLQEAVDFLVTNSTGKYVDATFGRGGHTGAILERLAAQGRLLAIDRDPQAIAWGSSRFAHEPRLSLEQASFADLGMLLERHGLAEGVDGVLLDLGVSSPQLDDAGRGFSFMQDGPLDMRMDPGHGFSAAQWLARARAEEIEKVLREYGEERFARRMAAAIVRERAVAPISTTARLAEILTQANPAWEKGKHPATRGFQAIRIFINGELEALASALQQAMLALATGGRLVVISFHSLEDRIVKRFMRDNSRAAGYVGLPGSMQPQLRRIGKALRASGEEVRHNPRARSAVLRVAEKLQPRVPAHG